MRILTSVTLFIATSLCCLAPGFSLEYEDESKTSFISRRAIDGTRGRKYYDPQADGFFDDYGSEKGRYYGAKESTSLSDIRNNVPGEPGVDYPAYVNIPKTTFSCVDRERGYYADEEAGCQVFHVCDDGLVSSFLCPVGSLFSQRLLTCDWWSKVPCSQSHQFYGLQSHPDDLPLTDEDMLRQALTENNEYRESTADKDQQTAQVFVSVRRNENQLTDERKRRTQHRSRLRPVESAGVNKAETDDSKIVRIKPVPEEERRSRDRGYSSFRSSSQGQRRRPPQQVSSAEPGVTVSEITIGESPITSAATQEEENRNTGTTPLPRETSAQTSYQDSSTTTFVETSTKRGLEEGVNETSPTEFGNHNSAYEFDDMEGKESIGLIHSASERNLEKDDERAATTENVGDQRSEATTMEFVETSTPANVDKVDFTTPQDESIQAKESIGLGHSKVQEKLQLFDNEKLVTTESPADQSTRESVKPYDEETTHNSNNQQHQSESSTLSNNYVESSTETSDETSETEAASTTRAPRTQEVRKMSGFRINVNERKPTEPTTLPADEVSSSDYQELPNSSNHSFASTELPVTTQVTEEQTTVELVRRISDTVDESNSPFEVTVATSNYSNSDNNNHDQNPVATDALSGLISQQINQKINYGIIKSEQTNQDFSYNQNQHQISSSSTPGVRTYQHIRNYQNQDYRTYQPQPVTASTPSSNKVYHEQYVSSTTEQPPQNNGQYENYQDESSGFTNYQPIPPTTTQEPQQNYVNYQNHKDESAEFFNYHEQDEFRNFRNPKAHNFVSTTVRNFLLNEDDSFESKNHRIRPFASGNLNNFQSTFDQFRDFKNYNKHRNEQEDYRNYPVNYQTHHYPENFGDYKQNQQSNENKNYPENFGDYKQSQQSNENKNYQSSESFLNFQQSAENSDNFKNKHNYADYQNYDSSEEFAEAPNFRDFGVRLSAKNQKTNTLRVNEKANNKNTDDAYTINSGLQGKTANFLWTMTQLAKSDRLPRPFTQPQHKDIQNVNDNNNFHNVKSSDKSNVDNANSFKQVSRNNNAFNNYDNLNRNNSESAHNNNNVNYNANFNHNIQQNYNDNNYAINVDEFAAPRLEVYDKPPKQSAPSLNHRQNVNDLRQERILNYNRAPPSTESPAQFNTYSGQSAQVNAPSFSGNQQFLPIPQSDFQDYNVANTRTPDENIQVLPNSHPIDYNFQQSTPPSTDYNFQQSTPQSTDYNFQQSTPQSTDYNFQQSTLRPADYSSQQSTSQPIDYNFKQSTQQPVDYNFKQSTQQPVDYNFKQSTQQPVDYNFKQSTQQPVDYNFEQSTQQPVDYNFKQSTEYNFHQSAPQSSEFNFQQDTSEPIRFNYPSSTPQPVDYNNHQNTPQSIDYNSESTSEEENFNSPHSTMPTFESTRLPEDNAPIVTNIRPQAFNHNFHKSTTPNRVVPPRFQHQFQHVTTAPLPDSDLKNTQPVDYDFQPATQAPTEDIRTSSKIIQTLTNTRPIFDFRPTLAPSADPPQKQEVKHDNFNITKMLVTTKTTVETEFIPSLSFDFGSDQGKQEYLEALEKGLVANDEALSRSNKDASASTSEQVEKLEDASAASSKSNESSVIDNFKDTGEVMSEAE